MSAESSYVDYPLSNNGRAPVDLLCRAATGSHVVTFMHKRSSPKRYCELDIFKKMATRWLLGCSELGCRVPGSPGPADATTATEGSLMPAL